eukprot:3389750-Rhodomonas_salina.3
MSPCTAQEHRSRWASTREYGRQTHWSMKFSGHLLSAASSNASTARGALISWGLRAARVDSWKREVRALSS